MIKYKSLFSVLLLTIFVASPSRSLVLNVYKYTRTDDINVAIEIWADNHYEGNKEKNLAQLKTFIQSYLLKNPTHLIIESKFFYGVDYKTTNIAQFIDSFNIKLRQARPWSFIYTPQERSQSTWIAWELPYLLLSIFNNEALPTDFELNDDQRKIFIKNVTFNFFDPRLNMDDRLANPDNADEVSSQVKKKFADANKSSPEKIKPLLSSYVDSRFDHATDNTEDPSYLGHIFDIEALSSIMPFLIPDKEFKKIVIPCGEWHAEQLRKILPTLGFPNMVKLQLAQPNTVRRRLF